MATGLFSNLSEQVIDLWTIELAEAERYQDYCWTLLSADEQNRADHFHFTHLRNSFVVSRALLRIVAAGYLGIGPQRLRFVYGPQGKPSLDLENSSLQFNLSHAGSLVVYEKLARHKHARIRASHEEIARSLEGQRGRDGADVTRQKTPSPG